MEIFKSIQEVFPSDLIEVTKLEGLFSQLLDKEAIGEKKYFEIMVAVSEAFNNAIKHGNRFDKRKFVVLKAGTSQKLLWCRITDQGLGFTEDEIPNPLEPENLTKDSGRGVFLIKQLSTGYNFRSTKWGYEVSMAFYIG